MVVGSAVIAVVETLNVELTRYARGLHAERARRPSNPRDRADIDFLVTRLGRMQQFLQASHMLAKAEFGSSVAPIARAMWETWIDTAWLLLEPKSRAEAFWASAGPQCLALFELYERYEPLTAQNQQIKTRVAAQIDREPHLYQRWVENGKVPWFNQFRWQGKSIRQLAVELQANGRLGKDEKRPYMHSYDYDYSRLCSVTHGDALELDSLIVDLPDGSSAFFTGAGGFDAMGAFLSGCGAALLILVELYAAGYEFGDYAVLVHLEGVLEELRSELGS